VRDPITSPVIAAPTTQDAKALADRVHAVVSLAIEERQFGGPGGLASRDPRTPGI
jgi:hypothetical protein